MAKKPALMFLFLLANGVWGCGHVSGGNDDASMDADSDSDSDTDSDADGDSDTGSDADSDSDTDSETDSDADTDTSYCGTIHEIQQPSTNLCWRRCPLGQTWIGNSCVGTPSQMNWCDASGITVSDVLYECTASNPGVDICEHELGTGFRLPVRQEFVNLLGGCDDDVLGGSGYCSTCVQSTACAEMFGFDDGRYWASAQANVGVAWYFQFGTGWVGLYTVDYSFVMVHCVRTGP